MTDYVIFTLIRIGAFLAQPLSSHPAECVMALAALNVTIVVVTFQNLRKLRRK